MNAAHMQKVVARREGIKLADDEGLICFPHSSFEPSGLIMTLTYSRYNVLFERCWLGAAPSGVMVVQELKPRAAKRESDQPSQSRRHGDLRSIAPVRFHHSDLLRLSVAPTVPHACIYFSHVRSGTWHLSKQLVCGVGAEIWQSQAAALQQENAWFNLHAEVCVSQTHTCHVNWFQESFEPQRNLCGAY